MSKKEAKNQGETIRFKNVFADDYNPVFANGVWGGFTTKGELNMNFFHERQPVPHSVYYELLGGGELGKEIARDPDPSNLIVVRYITTGVVLNYGDAKSIHKWIGEQIEEFEKQTGISELIKSTKSGD